MQLRALNWERREGEEGGRELAGFLRSRVETGALSTGCWIPRRLVASTFTLWCGRHRGPGTWRKWSPRLTVAGGRSGKPGAAILLRSGAQGVEETVERFCALSLG